MIIQFLIFANDAANPPPPDGFFNIPASGFFARLDDKADVLAGAAGAVSFFAGASFSLVALTAAGFDGTIGFAGKLDFAIGLFFKILDATAFLGCSSSFSAPAPS